MNFTDATTKILQSDDPALDLRLADDYIGAWKLRGDSFVLPREYAHLKPVIERYAGHPERLLRLVRAVRDEVAEVRGTHTEAYVRLQEFLRTLSVRHVQAWRRARLRAAVDWLSRQQPQLTVEERKLWARRLELRWKKQRLAWLAAARKQAGGRLSEDARAEALEEFWASVDEQINVGALPLFE